MMKDRPTGAHRNYASALEVGGVAKVESWLLDILACPLCRGSIGNLGDRLVCFTCATSFPLVSGVPVLTPEPMTVETRSRTGNGHQIDKSLPEHLRDVQGCILHLGSTGTSEARGHVVTLDRSLFPDTNIIGHAERLPFMDGAFGAVVALNVFEHLPDPEAAAGELERVLAPRGRVVIQTASLQPLHGDPPRYFNATEAGLRRWFRNFDVDDCRVTERLNPSYALSWFASELLSAAATTLGPEAAAMLEASTLASWSGFWRDPGARDGGLWQLMQRLPPEVQSRLAAGFELVGTKPGNPPAR